MRNALILLFVFCLIIPSYSQKTKTNISQLRDGEGDVYFRITLEDSIYIFEFATDDRKNHVAHKKTTGFDISQTNLTTGYVLPLDNRFEIKARYWSVPYHLWKIVGKYKDTKPVSLPKQQEYWEYTTDSIFPTISREIDTNTIMMEITYLEVGTCVQAENDWDEYGWYGDWCECNQWGSPNAKCPNLIGFQFRGGYKNLEICFFRLVINDDGDGWEDGYRINFSRWMKMKDLKLLLKKQVWQ